MKRRNGLSRPLAFVLALALAAGTLPMPALAEEAGEPAAPAAVTETAQPDAEPEQRPAAEWTDGAMRAVCARFGVTIPA